MKTPISKITWTPESIAAWRKSVQHWRRMATGKQKDGEGIKTNSCALCAMFFKPSSCSPLCAGCPVKQATGYTFCYESPWIEAANAYYDFGLSTIEFRAAARKELAFLESLRPTKKKRGGK